MTSALNTTQDFSKALESTDLDTRARAVLSLAKFMVHSPFDAFDLIIVAMNDKDWRIMNAARNHMADLAEQEPCLVKKRLAERLGQKQQWSGEDRTDILLLGIWARMKDNEDAAPVMHLAWRQAHEQKDTTLRGMVKSFAIHTAELPNLKFGSSAIN